jgi:hypothetical protein
VPRGDPAWRRAKGSWLIGLWWTVLLLSLLRFGLSNGPESDTSLSDIESRTTIAMAGVVAAAIAAVLAALVVWTLSRRQLDALRAQRTTYEAAGSGQPGPAVA